MFEMDRKAYNILLEIRDGHEGKTFITFPCRSLSTGPIVTILVQTLIRKFLF